MGEASALERELARELPQGHVLKGLRLRANSRLHDRDDVAYVLDDGRICVVHLTWNVESDPDWPYCEFVAELHDDESDEQQDDLPQPPSRSP